MTQRAGSGSPNNTAGMPRRDLLIGAAAGVALVSAGAASARPRGETWVFDDLRMIGGHMPTVIGMPARTDSPWGPALRFDGVGDGLLIDRHPLAGAKTFTVEALFRPDGGAFEQRWLHLESDDGAAPGKGSTRMLFEIRVVADAWYLDAFATGPGYNQTLIVPDKRFPVGRWYHVAQSFDGTTYRSFVDGVEQMAVPLAFVPQGPGRAAVGMRMNRVNFFHGAVRAACFTHRALAPAAFALR